MEPVPAHARAEVDRRLADIEANEHVRILLAVESGSRAWGFHSPDSDFDARFIFVRREDDYLALTPPRDVIETPLIDLMDVNGWDLSKALRLMMRGNSVIHEWLASPLVYRVEPRFMAALKPIAQSWRSAFADAHHYLGLLASQRGRHLDGRDVVKLKKYFYAIRPAIALQWLRERSDAPPMDLPGLLAGVSLPADAAAALEQLRRAKMASSEVGEGARIAALDAYIEEQAAWAMQNKGPLPEADPARIEQTNALFRAAVRGQLG